MIPRGGKKRLRDKTDFLEYKTAVSDIVDISRLKCAGDKGLISIVLPVFNGENYFSDAVLSVLKQTYKKFELIIVDDGSNDGTKSIAENFCTQDSRISLICHDENMKLPAALNTGFRAAKGELYTWISHDNIMLPTFIEEMKNELDANPDTAMVYGNMKLIDENGGILRGKGWYEYPPMSGNVILPNNTDRLNDEANNTIGAAFMYRASAAEFIGEYSVRRFGIEDYDYWMRMNELFCLRHTVFSEPLYLYRFHNKSLTSKDAELKITENRPELMEFDLLRRKCIFAAVSNDKTDMNSLKSLICEIEKMNIDELRSFAKCTLNNYSCIKYT